jgi:hypothetical protein
LPIFDCRLSIDSGAIRHMAFPIDNRQSAIGNREQVSRLWHPRLMATVFHEWHIGEAVQLGEPAVDIRHHGFEQDTAFHAAHAGAVELPPVPI